MPGIDSVSVGSRRWAHQVKTWCRAVPLALVASCMLCACSTVNTYTANGKPIRMTREEFGEYVEATFRYHNRVVSELITVFSMSDEDIPFPQALIRAEEDMTARCQPINEMVSAMIEGREQSLWTKLQLLNSTPLCEAATQQVEQLIPSI